MLQPIDPKLLEEILSQTTQSQSQPEPAIEKGGGNSPVGSQIGAHVNTPFNSIPSNHHLEAEKTTEENCTAEEKTLLHSVRERWHEMSESLAKIAELFPTVNLGLRDYWWM